MYAGFMIEVLNDKETGNELLIKAKESISMKNNFEISNQDDLTVGGTNLN